MLTHPQLMARIEQYSFDNPETSKPAFGFLDRLCVETGWGKCFAQGALKEYRRFVYLAVTGDRPVTPSREVDAVWHLHLTYTRSYWERLMPILPRALHHEPTPGGAAAAATYRSQYADTLDRYAVEFDEPPPDAFWPPEAERFQSDLLKMRRGYGAGRKVALFGGLGVGALALAMPAFAATGLGDNVIVWILLSIGALLAGLGLIALLSSVQGAAHAKKDDRKSDSGGGYVPSSGCGSSGGKGDGKGDADGGADGGGDGGGGCGGGCGG
jgi:hypothetical protein